MKPLEKFGKMVTVKDEFPVCRTCRSKMHGIRIKPDTRAENLEIVCERCKTVYKLNIDSGQCFDSPRPE